MLRQRPARRSAALESRNRDLGLVRRGRSHLRFNFALRGSLLKLGEFEFKLLQDGMAFGRLAIPIVAELGDRKLQLLDLERQHLRASFGVARLRFRLRARTALGDQHRLQCCWILRKRIACLDHAKMESQVRCSFDCWGLRTSQHATRVPWITTYPASCGWCVRCGARQS